ncbi:Hexaprenyldihydroxybenzoate methyltransferase, mitochondrial [Elasticomyces elasticus]|nr:Hexaprenyldihydroxybenzoate methyltransferase, mitochondrial [Elasticomyces elasticus]
MAASILRSPTGLRQAVVHPSVRFTPSRIASSCLVSRSYATAETASPTSSVNHTEVSHFNALASSWWDPHGSSRLLHLMNPLRHDFLHLCLAPEVRDPNQKLNFLDIGCGGGIFAESAARLAMAESVTAIDPTPEVIAVAKRHQRTDPDLLEPRRLTYLQTSIEDLHMHSDRKQYDIISLFEVIEHIQRPFPFLTASVLPYLKPGGWLIGSTIARHPVSWFTTKFMAEDVLGLVPRGTHDWSQYLQPQEVRDWARREPDLSTSEGLGWHVQGVVYVPGVGWKPVNGSEVYGNYFFGVKKREDSS